MINFRRTLLLIATPLVIGSVGFVSANRATAQADVNVKQEQTEKMGGRKHQRPDFAAAATELGVTEEALKTALGVPETRPENGQRPPRPDFEAAANELGVTEEALKQALGVPRNRPDLDAAATQLGITKTELKTALGLPS